MTCGDCSLCSLCCCSVRAGVVNIFSSINTSFLFVGEPSSWSCDHHRTHVTQCHMRGHDTVSWRLTIIITMRSSTTDLLHHHCSANKYLYLHDFITSKLKLLTLQTDIGWVFYWSFNFVIGNHLRIKFDYLGYWVLQDNKDAVNSQYNLVLGYGLISNAW